MSDALRRLPATELTAEPEDFELAVTSINELTERLGRIPVDEAMAPAFVGMTCPSI